MQIKKVTSQSKIKGEEQNEILERIKELKDSCNNAQLNEEQVIEQIEQRFQVLEAEN